MIVRKLSDPEACKTRLWARCAKGHGVFTQVIRGVAYPMQNGSHDCHWGSRQKR